MVVLVDLHLWTDIDLTPDEVVALVRARPGVYCTGSMTHARSH